MTSKKQNQKRNLKSVQKPESKLEQTTKEHLLNLPLNPGVYLMQNREKKVIYIGKAKALRSRVLSYFNNKQQSLKNRFLLSQIHNVDYIVTENEVEAFLLEASLIKKHRPRYNIRLKDDKAYPYIRCKPKDPYPRLYFERKVRDRESLYFGPYTESRFVRSILNFVNQNFQIRDCSDRDFKTRTRPCLTHQIGCCEAPCVQLVSGEEYHKKFKQALLFLKGERKNLKEELRLKMEEAAHKLHFETAARIRDNLKAMEMLEQKQTVVSESLKDVDAVALKGDERGTLIEVLHARRGKVIGNRHHFLKNNLPTNETLLSFLNQYYEENLIPDKILIAFPLKKSLIRLLRLAFSKRKRKTLEVLCITNKPPALIKMAQKNSEHHFQNEVEKAQNQKEALLEIQKKFHLPHLPFLMECYDISHWQGKQSLGSKAVFENGLPSKKDYRLYALKTKDLIDDFKALEEVLKRRLKHTEEKSPDMILIDGGKGQLGAVCRILKKLNLNFPVVSLAKDRIKEKRRKNVSSSGERFYLPGRKNPLIFRSSSTAFRLLLHLRDEAHRFAVESHRKKRNKSFLQSRLDSINGLGPARKRLLLKHFTNFQKITKATEEEIANVKGISKALAKKIKNNLK